MSSSTVQFQYSTVPVQFIYEYEYEFVARRRYAYFTISW